MARKARVLKTMAAVAPLDKSDSIRSSTFVKSSARCSMRGSMGWKVVGCVGVAGAGAVGRNVGGGGGSGVIVVAVGLIVAADCC